MATPNDRAILNSIVNPLFPLVDEYEVSSNNDSAQYNLNQDEKVLELEKHGIHLAETGKLEEALKVFNEAIDYLPNSGSAYNNRAQVLRLLERNEEAMNDLNKAIEFSRGKGKAGCQAYCQRAMLYQLSGNLEEAMKDWESASKLGSQFARNQVVKNNPYAALCNKMLHDVFQSLKEGKQ